MTLCDAPAEAPGSAPGQRPFFTIGHSTRPFEVFVELLVQAGVSLVVDVRTAPGSRTNPQYGQERLAAGLEASGLGYERHPLLGGWRGKQPLDEASPNTYWRLKSFRNYADYAMSPAFAAALEQLRRVGHRQTCAIMCAEAVWWRCHRRLITDNLIVAGEEVRHILGPRHVVPAELNPGARIGPDGVLTYPAAPDASADPTQG